MNDNGFMTTREVAEFLHVTEQSVYNWLWAGKLKGSKAGDVWRIRRQDVEDFLKPNKAV